MTLNSAAGQITEYENADKENKYKQKFNMRMSKYGHNQFRPSAVINSVAQAGSGAAAGFNAGPKLGGGNQQPALPRPSGTQE